MSKAERTTKYIIETVAPIFNKNGYSGTSLSDITEATGMTKGAVYGNFDSKEDLALKAFNHNLKKVFDQLTEETDKHESIVGKLKAMTNFYRNYPFLTSKLGGCPLLNVGVDSNHQNDLLYNRVKEVNYKLKRNLANLIQIGINTKEIRNDIDTDQYAGIIIGMIEGGVYMSFIMDSAKYMIDMMDQIDRLVDREMMN